MKKAIIFSLVYCVLYLVSSPAHAQSVDILWQGGTYTPPFFEGLPLWSRQSQITFVAVTLDVPNPNNLFYKWIRNGTVLGLVSGIGKGSLSFSDTIFSKPVNIGVEVLDVNENLIAQNSITVSPTESYIEVYENHPLYGFLFNRAVLGAYTLEKSEVTFAVFPLYFSVNYRDDPELKYSWKSINGTEPQSMVTYRAPEDTEGTASISLEIAHIYFLRQLAKSGLLIEFGK